MSAYDVKAEAIHRINKAMEGHRIALADACHADLDELRLLQGEIKGLDLAKILIHEAYKHMTGDG